MLIPNNSYVFAAPMLPPCAQGCHLAFLKGEIRQIWLFKNCLPEIKWFGYLVNVAGSKTQISACYTVVTSTFRISLDILLY